MSDLTKHQLDAAIVAHIADESDGDLVTGWVLQAATVPSDSDDRFGYFTDQAHRQPVHTSIGLVEVAALYYQVDAAEMWSNDD